MINLFTIILSIVFLLSSQNSFANQNSFNLSKYPQLRNSQYLFLMDQDTKEVLLEKNADTRIAPSSMTKLMTAYVVFDQLKKGNINLHNECLIGKDAWKKRGSTMFLNYGDVVDINQLLTGLLVVSGNDAAVALAESISGSIDKFSELMNETGKKIGLKNSNFKNPHGLNQYNHYMTLRDLSILSSAITNDFPEYSHYFVTTDFTYQNITQKNRNPLIKSGYIGATGMKTGHTNDGGYGMVGTAIRDSRKLVAITNQAKTSRQRGQIVSELLNYGFDDHKKINLFDKNIPISNAKIWLGNKNKVSLVSKKNISFTILQNQDINDFKVEIKYQEPLYAPIEKGQKIGVMVLKNANKKIIEIPLFAKESIDKANYFARIHQIFKYQIYQFLQIIKN